MNWPTKATSFNKGPPRTDFQSSTDPLREAFKKTSPPSAWVAAMRSVQEQNCKTKLYGNIFEMPLKLFAKLSPSQPANLQLGAEIALISQLS